MKYLILGNGYLGKKFQDFLGAEAILADFRVNSYPELLQNLKSGQPRVLINCIGRTGQPNVDWCETHKGETLFANVAIPVMIARACAELGLYWVHIGSGCIYEGDNYGQGFSEEDPANFQGSFYSRTKAWSETMLREFENVLQLRLRIPVDCEPAPKNLIDKLVKYRRVADVTNSMSVVPDFLLAAQILMDRRKTGIYNVTNPGSISNITVMEMYREIIDPAYTYEKITPDQLNRITLARRSNCVLNVRKLLAEGIDLPPIQEALRRCLQNYRANQKL